MGTETMLQKVAIEGGGLQLSPMLVNKNYCEEWNERLNDFVVLSRDGEMLRNTLYRVGGLNTPNLAKDNYFMLLKYVEAYYSSDILRMSKSDKAKHLEGRWCILDKYGNEKVEFEQFKHPYLVKNSCIYSVDRSYHNIETGELYCNASSSIESTDYLFLENRFDSDKSKCGVMKIDKRSGKWELFT